MSQKKKQSAEEIIKNLSEEQKEKVLSMKRPNKVANYKNYDEQCNFITQECGFSLLEFDEVQRLLRNMSKEAK